MPVPPPPQTFACRECGWKKTTAPRSDVLFPGIDVFDHCPACSNRTLDVRRARGLDAFGSVLRRRLGLT